MKITINCLLFILFTANSIIAYSQTYKSSVFYGTPPVQHEVNPLKFKGINGMVVNSAGEIIATDGNNMIRKVTNFNKIEKIAGTGKIGSQNGDTSVAEFNNPKNILFDNRGNLLVLDDYGSRIRKITPEGIVSTINGEGTPSAGKLGTVQSMTIDDANNLYVTGSSSNEIKKIDTNGVVSVCVEFTNYASHVQYYNKTLYYLNNYEISYTDLKSTSGWQYTLMPTGISYIYDFYVGLGGMIISTDKGVYKYNFNSFDIISYSGFNSITYSSQKGIILGGYQDIYTTMPGQSLSMLNLYPKIIEKDYTDFKNPQTIATDKSGNIYFADRDYNRILKIDKNKNVAVFAGSKTSGFEDGMGEEAKFNSPTGLCFDNYGNLLVSDFGNRCLRKITPDRKVTTFRYKTGTPLSFKNPYGLAVDSKDNIYIAIYSGDEAGIQKISPDTILSTYISDATFNIDLLLPIAVRIDKNDNLVFADQGGRKLIVVAADKSWHRVIGTYDYASKDGHAGNASFKSIQDIAYDKHGNLFVLDQNIVRKISTDSMVTTIAGNSSTNFGGYKEGEGPKIQFDFPWGITVDDNDIIYISDTNNNLIRTLAKDQVTGVYEEFEPSNESKEFLIYPNPTNSHINIKSDEIGTIIIYNNIGTIVKTYELEKDGNINLNGLLKGLYFIAFKGEKSTYYKSFVLE